MSKKLNGAFKIEKGIKAPSKRGHKYPLAEMSVGDSFFVPDGAIKHIGGSLYPLAAQQNIKISIRTVDGGHRVWRTA